MADLALNAAKILSDMLGYPIIAENFNVTTDINGIITYKKGADIVIEYDRVKVTITPKDENHPNRSASSSAVGL